MGQDGSGVVAAAGGTGTGQNNADTGTQEEVLDDDMDYSHEDEMAEYEGHDASDSEYWAPDSDSD